VTSLCEYKIFTSLFRLSITCVKIENNYKRQSDTTWSRWRFYEIAPLRYFITEGSKHTKLPCRIRLSLMKSRPLNCFCEIGLLIATVRDANDGYLLSRILLLVLRDAGRAVIRLCARARVACASIRSLFVPFYTCVYTTYILTDLRCPRETAALHVVCNEVHIRYARASRRRLQWALSGRITMNDAFSVQHVTTCQ